MATFIIRRVFLSIFVIIVISFVVFMLSHLSGDPAALMMPATATAEDIEQYREEAGFNDPILEQYARFFISAVRGEFGRSLRYHQSSLPLVLERLPATLQLSIFAMILCLLFAVPLGIIAAVHRGSMTDMSVMFLAVIGQSMPNFWLGTMLIFLFAVQLRWLPTGGSGGFQYLILPGVTMAINLMAIITRLIRSSTLEVLSADYIRTARGKGLSNMTVLFKHAFRNALLPVVTVIGLQFGYILGGAVVIETVFSWPGVGLLTINAIYNRDFPLVQAAVVVLAVAIILINTGVDILYSFLDPRVKLESSNQ